jgi:hypothetical protein
MIEPNTSKARNSKLPPPPRFDAKSVNGCSMVIEHCP